ncbi:hypothetical protein C8R46DRAFT_1278716 [Mycena filopes]|nr:hypothetical protein C8R46DRAFT_1278716 [Mycena filopes]
MKFITVLNLFSAMVLGAVAAPVHDSDPESSPARTIHAPDGQLGPNSDVFEPMDLTGSPHVRAASTNENHPKPHPPPGCVIA